MPLVVPAVVVNVKGEFKVASKVPGAAVVGGAMTEAPPGVTDADGAI